MEALNRGQCFELVLLRVPSCPSWLIPSVAEIYCG